MLEDLTVKNFMSTLASDAPVPGGGSAASMAGATGANLIAMVASLTINKKGYEEAWEEMKRIKVEAEELGKDFLKSMDTDADSYARVIECYKLPKDTDEEKKNRSEAIQAAITEAANIPLEIAEKALSLFDYASTVIEKGNKNAASDGAVAAIMARSAVLGALYNVRINAASLKNKEAQQAFLSKAERLEKDAIKAEAEILSQMVF